MKSSSTLTAHNLHIESLRQKIICQDFNVTFRSGEIWGILGRNGCGKTTFLQTLAGLYKPQKGNIFLNQQSLQQISRRKAAQNIGILFQENPLNYQHTVFNQIKQGRYPHLKTWQAPSQEDQQIVINALKQMNLEHLTQNLAHQLSGGERQRVALATLLAQTPKIYLLDEPLQNLDVGYQQKTLQIFARLAQQQACCVIMVLHDLHLAQRICDHFIFFLPEKGACYGTVHDLRSSALLKKLYDL